MRRRPQPDGAQMSYDPECLRLARHFLPESASDRLKTALAQHIQDEVENWLSAEAKRLAAEITRKPS